MRLLLRPLQWIYFIYAAILFIAIMLIIFPFSLLAPLFGRIRGGNFVIGLCRFWADCWFPLIFIFQKRIYEAPHDKSKPFIFVTNHISYLDAAILPKAFRQPVRPLGKVEMAKVPVFGFIYRHAIVSVDRSSAANRARSVREMRYVLSKNVSMVVFPEGTFNMGTTPLKEFYDGAFRLAIEMQTPIKPVLFLDAYRRLPYESLWRLSPGRCRVLYLSEIPVDGLTGADAGALRDEVFELMQRKLVEYDGSWRKS